MPAAFRLADDDKRPLEVHADPLEAARFVTAEACVQRRRHLCVDTMLFGEVQGLLVLLAC
jgi:hypothetical protein